MTTITEENFKNKETYVELAQAQMDKWRGELKKLEYEIMRFPKEVQAAYMREIGQLQSKLEQVESTYEEMNKAGIKQWDETRYQWGKRSAEYWQEFMAFAEQILSENRIPLG